MILRGDNNPDTGGSKHNTFPSMAVDAGPYFSELKNTDWKDAKAFAAFAGYVQRVAHELLEKELITHDVRWGGDWDGDGRTSDLTRRLTISSILN